MRYYQYGMYELTGKSRTGLPKELGHKGLYHRERWMNEFRDKEMMNEWGSCWQATLWTEWTYSSFGTERGYSGWKVEWLKCEQSAVAGNHGCEQLLQGGHLQPLHWHALRRHASHTRQSRQVNQQGIIIFDTREVGIRSLRSRVTWKKVARIVTKHFTL